MENEDGSLVTVFNGEIYNSPELRRYCEAKGHTFRSSMEGEVILHLWGMEGDACVRRLNGIFSVAVASTITGEVVVARDLLGVKPLFYSDGPDGSLWLASELAGLRATGAPVGGADPVALPQFLPFLWVPDPRTPFGGVRSLQPGQALRWGAGGRRLSNYGDALAPHPTPDRLSDEAFMQQARHSFGEAAERQLLADVPIGLMASGGVDSGLLWWATKATLDRAYTICRDDGGDFEGLGDDRRAVVELQERLGTPVSYLTGAAADDTVPPSGDLFPDPAYDLTRLIARTTDSSRATRRTEPPGYIPRSGGEPMTASVLVSYLGDHGMGPVRSAIRQQLAQLLGTSVDRPLAGIVEPGKTVVIKPNMVRHFNPAGPLDAVITAPSIVRVLAEVAFEQVGPAGRVIVADSPQNDCNFQALLETPGWSELLAWAAVTLGGAFAVLDMRPEEVVMEDGIITSRRKLPGDPLGEVVIDLCDASAFHGSGISSTRLRGSDYDADRTRSSHVNGHNSYSICRSFLDADLLIVVPKVKTHKKVGLSLAMKNLVGIVGEKNCLPHHTAGFAGRGGDEYPIRSLRSVTRQWAVERARTLLARGTGVHLLRRLRRLENALLPEFVARSGNWSGNDTAWRMVLDLVTILRREREDSGRPTLFVYDGLVVGEGDGPLAPSPLVHGMIASSLNPASGDAAVATTLGVDFSSIPLLREAITRNVWSSGSGAFLIDIIAGVKPSRSLLMHPGWRSGAPVASQ